MGKKRKPSRNGAAGPAARQHEEEAPIAAKYDQNEQFADSQDEFFAGKEEIMLEEGPSRKRRKQLDEEGIISAIFIMTYFNKLQSASSNHPTKKSSATTPIISTTKTTL